MFKFFKRLFTKKIEPVKPNLAEAVKIFDDLVNDLDIGLFYLIKTDSIIIDEVQEYINKSLYNLESLRDEVLILYRQEQEKDYETRFKSSIENKRINK